MSLGRIERKLCVFACAAAAAAAAVASAGEACAQTQATNESVSVTGKGIVGGALLGGEVVMITMGAVGVESGWPYLVFGGLGAVGGGVGGFFIEGAADPTAEIPVYMLAAGMALVIPTIVISLNATAYKPPDDDKSEPANDRPALEPAPPGGSVTVTTSRAKPAPRTKLHTKASAPIPRIPLALLGLSRGDLALGIPAPDIRPMYTRRELAEYGVTQGHEVRVPLFSVLF